jgi:outer membrane protein assembly factor BamB
MGLLLLALILSACGGAPVPQNWPGLTLADDTIYVISGLPQKVYMLDASNGTEKGTFAVSEEQGVTTWWSPVTVGGDLAFVGYTELRTGFLTADAGQTSLYAFDPETGTAQWSVDAESFILPAPFYIDGVVYFGASDGCVYAVDVETKRLKSNWPPRDDKGEFVCQTEEAIWATPLVVDGRVYVAAMDHYVYTFDAETGNLIWKSQVGGAMAAPPTLALEDDILYVGAFDGQAYALEAESGKLVEGFGFQASNWIWSRTLAHGGQLYVTSLDGNLYALDPSNGAEIWSYCDTSVDDNGRCNDMVLRAGPVEAASSIIIASESGKVIALEDAVEKWKQTLGSGAPEGGILTTPVVSEDTVYVVLQDGTVQTLDAETGALGWDFPSPESE